MQVRLDPLRSKRHQRGREGGQEGEREGVKKEGGVKEGKTHRGEGRKKGRMGEREGGKTRVT